MILQSVNELTFKPSNIISLVPSQTELLYYLGSDAAVTGITRFCIHPVQWQKTKTIIGGTKNIKPAIIKKLCPDLIIANKEENEKEQIETLAKDYNVWLTDITNLKEALQMISDIGLLTGMYAKANELAKQIEMSFKQMPVPSKKIRTCYLIWQEPYMTAGGDTFINDMLTKCGFENIYSDKTRYPVVEINELKNCNCELIILSSEPYPFKQKHIDQLNHQLPNIKIILADGEMFSWYGSRLLKAAGYFSTLIAAI